MPDNNAITITLKDVYDEVRRLHDQVADMTPQGQLITDHEARLRQLERWRYALPGSLILAVVSTIITVVRVG